MNVGTTGAVIGAQFGDEGKGKIVDMLTPDYDLIVRFQGGNNAGHTLVVVGKKTVLHHIPSGILHDGTRCLMGAGCVFDPNILIKELEGLCENGVPAFDRFGIAGNAAVILPTHRELDAAREAAAGSGKIGTTKRGIGPAYEDRTGRVTVLARDLCDKDMLRSSIEAMLPRRNQELNALGAKSNDVDEIIDEIWASAQKIAPLVTDVALEIEATLARGGAVLFEGAQGALLDRTYGTMPFVTSSRTCMGEIFAGGGLAPRAIDRSVAIVKAYQTRVGSGPFPTELHSGATLEHLREVGAEYGSTTGRPRRCGWLDLPLLRYVCTLNGFTEIALTKVDVLQGLETIKVCTAYTLDGEEHASFAPWRHEIGRVEPTFTELAGFTEDITQCSSWEQLPRSAQALVELIERETGVHVRIVSLGPGREQYITR